MKKKILVVGEFMSHKDAQEGRSFSDGNGRMFKSWMKQSGIDLSQCEFTNVLPITTPGKSSIAAFTTRDKDAALKSRPPILVRPYQWLDKKYAPYLDRLDMFIRELQPNLILAVGELAAWALLNGRFNISEIRGRIAQTSDGVKVLPMLSMRDVQMDWPMRIALRFDMEKAARECNNPTFRRPERLIYIPESIADCESFFNNYLANAKEISADIETYANTITCIGFAPDERRCLVVPFYSRKYKDHNYWRSHAEEVLAWKFAARVLAHKIALVGGQNFQYDMQYLWRQMGIPVPAFGWDTMLLHHALQPELRKGIGFQASLYSDEPTWKHLSRRASADRSGKKEDD